MRLFIDCLILLPNGHIVLLDGYGDSVTIKQDDDIYAKTRLNMTKTDNWLFIDRQKNGEYYHPHNNHSLTVTEPYEDDED